MLTEFQLSEGRYNARDVLATARLYAPLAGALATYGVIPVYLHDREMAKLALQMHRQGMPIDEDERKRVGNTLRKIRDEATQTLLQHTESPEFVAWAATLVNRIGPYPAGYLTDSPKQGTRLRRCECPGCGYLARVSGKSLSLFGPPICPSDKIPMKLQMAGATEQSCEREAA